MKISKIQISNYRGIMEDQEIPLSNFSSIVGQNDSGKSIILNAIASFLNLKEYPITHSDFNDPDSPIEISCTFRALNLPKLLASKIKSKIKKADGLDEFLTDLIIAEQVTIKKTIIRIGIRISIIASVRPLFLIVPALARSSLP